MGSHLLVRKQRRAPYDFYEEELSPYLTVNIVMSGNVPLPAETLFGIRGIDSVYLDRLARHFDADAPIPETPSGKMLQARNFWSTNTAMRQLSFGKTDLDLHLKHTGEDIQDVDATVDAILEG